MNAYQCIWPVVFGTAARVGPSADIQYEVPFTARD
jgi:hypothetical protein